MLHDSDASMYRALQCLAVESPHQALQPLASLLGSNYRFLLKIFPGWSVTFSSCHKFYSWRDEVQSFHRSLPCVPPFLRQGLWGLFFQCQHVEGEFLSYTPSQLSFLFWLGIPFHTTAGGPSHLLVCDGWNQEEQVFSDIINCKMFAHSKLKERTVVSNC